MDCAFNNHVCVGPVDTLLDASWYRVDSRLVKQGMLLVWLSSLVNVNIFPLFSAPWLVDDSDAVSLRYVLTRDLMMSFGIFRVVFCCSS